MYERIIHHAYRAGISRAHGFIKAPISDSVTPGGIATGLINARTLVHQVPFTTNLVVGSDVPKFTGLQAWQTNGSLSDTPASISADLITGIPLTRVSGRIVSYFPSGAQTATAIVMFAMEKHTDLYTPFSVPASDKALPPLALVSTAAAEQDVIHKTWMELTDFTDDESDDDMRCSYFESLVPNFSGAILCIALGAKGTTPGGSIGYFHVALQFEHFFDRPGDELKNVLFLERPTTKVSRLIASDGGGVPFDPMFGNEFVSGPWPIRPDSVYDSVDITAWAAQSYR